MAVVKPLTAFDAYSESDIRIVLSQLVTCGPVYVDEAFSGHVLDLHLDASRCGFRQRKSVSMSMTFLDTSLPAVERSFF